MSIKRGEVLSSYRQYAFDPYPDNSGMRKNTKSVLSAEFASLLIYLKTFIIVGGHATS